MILNNDSIIPIYLQLAEWLESQIINNTIAADEKMYSQYQLAEMFTVNPATAAKSLTILAEENVLYKKRGLGMFVSPEGKEIVLHKRIKKKLQPLVGELASEAVHLNIAEEDLIAMIVHMYRNVKETEEL
ncbi:putative transcriptional regulator [Fictibacillus macauensis ZFHKF-1]|uniref:Putative transcriptional regulator n=1 Tax=Fictibacillus macauensis ZFHKF-1 TaxID=1196324 RepID=I8AH97_9BACL|nr:GntR family transcriptional regulator [Fictibacillus macauensis]EIT84809.1 putative transcriptional regulator [Fictibacillus macauensis ZFHKF-1]